MVTTLSILAAVVALAVAACGPLLGTPAPSGTSLPTLAPPWTGPPGRSPSPTATAGGESAVRIDPALLEILPASVDGFEITENAEAEAATLGDPLLGEVGTAFAAGLAVEPASGEFVYAVVVELLPGTMDDGVFRDWRDSYDEGACSQADGVLGNAETEIDGRTVHIGTCVGGLRTYHVWLEDRGVLISASALGERRLGEILVENLRP